LRKLTQRKQVGRFANEVCGVIAKMSMLVLCALVVMFILGFLFAQRIRVTRLQIQLSITTPIRFVILSDIHIGANGRGVRKAQKFVRTAIEQHPDAILLLGDFVTSRLAIPFVKSALQGIQAPLGVYAVLGNHDHWAGANEIITALQDVGVRVLVNEGITLERDKTTIALVGVDDLWSGKPDWKKAFSKVPEDVPIVLLSHNPDVALFWMREHERRKFMTKHTAISSADLQRYGAFLQRQPVKLILSGHTHAGHVWMPLNRLLSSLMGLRLVPGTEYGWHYPHGLHDIGTTLIYITSGVTAGNKAPRWFNSPEVVVIEVR